MLCTLRCLINGCYRFCLLSFADDSHPNHWIERKASIIIHVTSDQVIECDFALKLSLKLLLKKNKEKKLVVTKAQNNLFDTTNKGIT